MSNHAHRRRRRAWPDGFRVRVAAFVDRTELDRLLDACTCPVVVIPGDPVVVEHHHRHGCPALARHTQRLGTPEETER